MSLRTPNSVNNLVGESGDQKPDEIFDSGRVWGGCEGGFGDDVISNSSEETNNKRGSDENSRAKQSRVIKTFEKFQKTHFK